MNSYKKIAKSSGLIASAQILKMAFSMVRNKVIAIALGTFGFGIWGLYQTLIEIIYNFSLLGVDKSGVREIAIIESKNKKEINETTQVLQILIWILSIVTFATCLFFSKTISQSLFQSDKYSSGIMIVSVVFLFKGAATCNSTILNGLQLLKPLASSQILGAAIGTCSVITLVYSVGLSGIPYFLLLIAISEWLTSYYFLRKNYKISPNIPFDVFKKKYQIFFKVGFGFFIAAIVAAASTYLARTFLLKEYNLESLGIYQASWNISNLYIGIILSAMGVDFMPRLTKSITQKDKASSLINEQMEFGTLLASFGIAFILIFSKTIITLLYSDAFQEATEIIRWQAFGVFFRVIGFPLSYAIMAKKKSYHYIAVQIIFWVSDYLLLVLISNTLGFKFLGLNYFFSYIIYLLLAGTVTYKLVNFKPSKLLIKIFTISSCFLVLSFIISFLLTGLPHLFAGVLTLIALLLWMNYYFKKYMNINAMSKLNELITSIKK
ncbi:oligosaccharide flippase family protein [uncultured Arcticibacterium sp.]|uniref:oligosaccharide flippase family protein n=1 Tax=uncultured Arcticibacterium sp. TaxID=2173042 RepID=UPI0030FC7813